MSREIKFRFWNQKKMYDVFGFTFDDVYVFLGTAGGQIGRLNRHNGVLLQYTGLKLHGQELYESDIVENVVGGEKYEIKKDDYHRLADVQAHPDTFIIIGNRLQNPELLKNE
jgi:hypothetical protein